MIQTVEQERAWWAAAGPENVWGIHAHGDGVDACLAEIAPLVTDVEARVLDLGCGPGRLAIPLARRFPLAMVWGLDIAEAMINRHSAEVLWAVGDGRTIPVGFGYFDLVYSVGLFQHLPHDAVAGYIAELGRVLRPGGRVRLQHVLGTEESFLSHQCTEVQLVGWCEDAGLQVSAIDVGRVHYQWVWITAECLT